MDAGGLSPETCRRMLALLDDGWDLHDVEVADTGFNDVYFLTVGTPAGTRECVLKVSDDTDDQVRAEARLCALLDDATDVPVPTVLGRVDAPPDLPAPYFLVERLPGEHPEGPPGERSLASIEGLARATGRHLGDVHTVDAFDAFGWVRAERDAFRRFATRVESVSAAGHANAGDAPVIARTKPPDSGMRAVTDAYRETVMGVDHFEAEYGEGLATNVSAELSPEVAAALADEERLTPQLRGALVTQAREAAVRREELLDALDGEAAALGSAGERLRDVEGSIEDIESTRFLDYSFEELQAAYGRLQLLRDDCEDVLATRQETVHGDSPGPERTNGPAFRQYVYDSLDVSFPVLADGTELLDRIDDAESKVVRSLLRRV